MAPGQESKRKERGRVGKRERESGRIRFASCNHSPEAPVFLSLMQLASHRHMSVMSAREGLVSDKSGFRGIIADVAKWQQFSESLSSHRRGGRSAKCTRQKRMLSLIPNTHGGKGAMVGLCLSKKKTRTEALGVMLMWRRRWEADAKEERASSTQAGYGAASGNPDLWRCLHWL